MNLSRHNLYGLRWLVLFGLIGLWPTVANAQPDVEEQEERAIKAAVASVAPSVVRIETFGGLERIGRMLVGTGPTTGLAVAEDGYVISSAFNFIQKPSSILVTLPSGKRASAEIVARDHSRMLVLLKVNADEPLVVPTAVPRSEMITGQWSIAVGRTFSKDQPNISAGILSATNRIWGKAIQTDAKISPSNYGGPLIDIRGRVLGVLVPLSPQGTGEIAGAQWYDSGIGFAVPLNEINPHLEKLKKGEDLYAGILGVSLKGGDIYSLEADLAAVPAKSPAAEAGLKPGDKIIEVDGAKIVRQAQLKHALGGKYAGEVVHIVVLRDKERIERDIKLTDKLIPYEHPFLGVLPMRDRGEEKGVVVRYVYPASPADEAGLKNGDHIVSLAGNEMPNAASMQEMLTAHEPKDTVKLKVNRDGKPLELEVQLATLPTDIPASLPNAHDEKEPFKGERPAVGVIEIKIPEEKNDCIAYVPENYDPRSAYGLLVWLHKPSGFDQDVLVVRWKKHCENDKLILLAPKSADPKRWRATEVDFIRKTIDDVSDNYNIDPARVVVHGHQAGGAMSFLVAFGHRDLIRGVAAVDSALPRSARPPSNDPIQRLAIYLTTAAKSKLVAPIKAGVKRLQELKFPVTVKDLGQQPRYLSAEEIAELVRWIDSLDRI